MDIEINGRHIQLPQRCNTLGDLLRSLELNGTGQAVAVNNRVVPRSGWEDFPLTEGMKITIIKAVCGG